MKERYSKVSRRLWNDARFKRLSAPPPNGQTLFKRLLTGPELSNIPGTFQAWEAGLAQALGWDLKGFQKAFLEVSREGMAEADWNAGLVWVPNAPKHNKPESPNVVRSWEATWSELPECDLKLKVYHALKGFAEAWGEAYAQAFLEACRKPSGNPCPNQEQEQEQEDPPNPPEGGEDVDQDLLVFDAWREETGHMGSRFDQKRRNRIRARRKEGFTTEQMIRAIKNRRLRPWLMGDNPEKKVYDGLETLLRDAAQVEGLLELTADSAQPLLLDDAEVVTADSLEDFYGTKGES